jgi:hypothetical protein
VKKKFWLYLCVTVCSIEVLLMGYFFVCGDRGLRMFMTYKEQFNSLEKQKKAVKKEIESIVCTIDNWNTYPLYREQWAREHLSLCFPDEDIYIDTNKKR